MKITAASFASILIYLGLPASFLAQAGHLPATGQIVAMPAFLYQPHPERLAPLLFVASVMSVAAIVVHHLREEQRLTRLLRSNARLANAALV